MRDVLGPGTILGYCTNVHAGDTPADTLRTLARDVAAVHQRVAPESEMGIGLWLSLESARFFFENAEGERQLPLEPELQRRRLVPFTFNGFPIGNFHSEVVKHRVYEPDWSHEDRWNYTILLARLHRRLLGDNHAVERSISTLPIGWDGLPCKPIDRNVAADRLLSIAKMLAQWWNESGLLIHLDLEPEPGCILQRSHDIVAYFKDFLLPRATSHGLDEEQVLRHIRVCHDVCHAAVMFEAQADVLARYRAAGIRVGKVQISSAIRADLRNYSARERVEALAQLRAFSEDRYLHQTMIASAGETTFYDDLPAALAAFGSTDRAGDEWRVHFHVPVYLDRFGLLQTTQQEIINCLRAIRPEDEVHHFEVETYAWNVLPAELRVDDLADGIAREIQWVREVAAREMQAAAASGGTGS